LALGLTTGSEIVVQKIVRLEPDFMVIRGRLAGTQDTGRIVVIPYAQLTFVAVQKHLQDQEVEGIFGKTAIPDGNEVAPPSAEPAPQTAPEPEKVNESPAAVNPIKKPEAASKAILLAKLRDRLKAGK
jgi:hypothetical protein